jgi:SNF2 family DNA or RNA helicase
MMASMNRYMKLLEHSGFDFKQHQYDGVEWCVRNELAETPIQNVRGGFIADEMGLGKTMLMIGTMFVNMLPRTLIILPPVLIEQWYNEIYRISGHKALLYYGTNKKTINFSTFKNARIIITSYHSALNDKSFIHKVKWNRIIFDEAHHLRNSKTVLWHANKKLKSNIRWLISGTPVQNRKQDFYSLCEIVGFKRDFYCIIDNVKIIGRNFILRRTKKQLGIYLPDVTNELVQVKWGHSF